MLVCRVPVGGWLPPPRFVALEDGQVRCMHRMLPRARPHRYDDHIKSVLASTLDAACAHSLKHSPHATYSIGRHRGRALNQKKNSKKNWSSHKKARQHNARVRAAISQGGLFGAQPRLARAFCRVRGLFFTRGARRSQSPQRKSIHTLIFCGGIHFDFARAVSLGVRARRRARARCTNTPHN